MLSSAKLQAIVCTTRMAEAVHFYSEILELKSVGGSLGARVYDVGGTALRLSPVGSMRPSEHTVLGFEVEDVAATARWLVAKGVRLERFENFPQDEDGILSLPDGTRVAWLRDPGGNLLSVVRYGALEK